MRQLSELFECIWDTIEASGAAARRPTEVVGKGVIMIPSVDFSLERFAVKQYLKPSLAAATKHGLSHIAKLISQTTPVLAWSQNSAYKEERMGTHFINNYVFGQLTGVNAPMARELPPCGFLLLGKHTEYPAHSHAPREVYLVLTPGGEWQLDRLDWFPVAPGQVIFHAPEQTHAMRTFSVPMLAFGAWLDEGERTAIAI